MRVRLAKACGALALLAMGSLAQAADHTDGTTTAGAALGDPSADINDVFAWMSPDTTAAAGKVYLTMDVFPGATATSKFSTTAKYVFHTQSRAAYGMAATKRDIICTFAGTTTQTVSCWVTDPAAGNAISGYLTGDASAAAGLSSADGKIKVFAGVRNDPFYFNLAGFRNAASAVAAAIANYTAAPATNHNYITGFDPTATECPVLTTAARSTVVGYLSKDCTGVAAAKDFFRKPEAVPGDCTTVGKPSLVTTGSANEPLTGNVLALVLSVDKTLLTPGGSILSVWAATTK